MKEFQLVHKFSYDLDGNEYLIEVYLRPDGSHFAQTSFSPEDVIISDGLSMEDVLQKHRGLLPLAVRLREIYKSGHNIIN